MPQSLSQSIEDFTVGQQVRVVSIGEEFGSTIARLPFDNDEVVTVTGVHPHGEYSATAGTLSIEGYTNETDAKPGWHPGAFGHLLFRPLDAASDTTGVVNRDIVLGDRVRVTDQRTRIGGHPLGSGGSSYVGKEGEVTRLASDSNYDTYGVTIDGDGYVTSWTREALDVLDTDATPDDAPPKVDIEPPIVTTTYASPLDVPDGTLARVVGNTTGLHSFPIGTLVRRKSELGYADDDRSVTFEYASPPDRPPFGSAWWYVDLCDLDFDDVPKDRDVDLEPPKGDDNVDHLQRVIADLRTDLDLEAATSRNRSDRLATLEAERTTLTQAASDERRRLCAEIDSLKTEVADLKEIRDRLVSDNEVKSRNLATTIREANEAEAVITFLLRDQEDGVALGVELFREGYRAGSDD